MVKNIISFLRIECFLFIKIWIPFTQGCFVQSLVEIGFVVLEKKIIKYRLCIFTFPYLSSLVEGCGPSFEQTWIPFTLGCFVPSLVEIGPGEEDENVKSLQMDRQTDDSQQAIRKAHFRWAKNEN